MPLLYKYLISLLVFAQLSNCQQVIQTGFVTHLTHLHSRATYCKQECTVSFKRDHRLYLAHILISNAHDCHPNPGPRPPKFPCQICGKACKWSKTIHSVACNNCELWYHTECMKMSTLIYETLNNSETSWYCCNCGLPNFHSSLFEDTSSLILNSTTPSTASSSNTTFNFSSDIGSPRLASSPKNSRIAASALSKRTLRILTINFQSMRAKREEFWALLQYSTPDIVICTETWLHPNIHEREVLPANYKFAARRDRKSSPYGGVAIVTSADIEASEIEVRTEAEFVAATIPTKSLKKPLIIGAMYRPPNKDLEAMQELHNCLLNISNKYPTQPLYFGGDTNLPDIDWSTSCVAGNRYPINISNTLLELIHDTGCEQMVTFPTRLENTLDIFATNRPSLVSKCTAIPGISDHDIVLSDVNILPSRRKPVARLIHLWKKADLNAMASQLTDFTNKFTTTTSTTTPINDIWDTFKKACTAAINKNVPSKMTSTRYSQPWCNRSIRQLSRRKKRAYKKARKTNTKEDWKKYKTVQKASKTECKEAYNNYVHDLVTEENSKKLYTFVKSKKCDGSGVAPLKKEGVSHVDASTKAEILNDQFASVFTKEDTESPLPDLGESLYPDAPPIRVTVNGVHKLLSGLNPNKATGPDSICSRFLKEMANPLAPALTLIFQASLDQGKIPDDWKTANVTPIYKKGDKSKPSNYRPISLTSISCKLLEHIIHSSLMQFFDLHNIISQYQHGFRKRHSCESQLITTVNDLVTGLDNSKQIDAILLDFSKAFDKVPHKRLLHKLQHYGVRHKTLEWIDSFLSRRTQKVLLDGCSSSPASVTSGVPQGTVLGPLLFLVYINDLPQCVKSTCRLFADDSLLYREINSEEDSKALQEDLDKLQEWERDWLMEFNADKCEVLRISKKRKNITGTYSIHGKTLLMTKKAKYLGVVLSPNLSWNAHVDSITQKANNTLAFLRRNVESCPPSTKEACYKSLVRPQVEYASTVWDPPTKTLTKRVEMVQRRAARFVSGDYRRTSSVGTMIGSLGWDSLEQRRTQAKAVMMYRVVHGLVAINLPAYLHPQGVSTRGHNQRYIPQFCRTQTMKQSFFPSAILIWNQLPDSLIIAPSLESFKTGIAAARH